MLKIILDFPFISTATYQIQGMPKTSFLLTNLLFHLLARIRLSACLFPSSMFISLSLLPSISKQQMKGKNLLYMATELQQHAIFSNTIGFSSTTLSSFKAIRQRSNPKVEFSRVVPGYDVFVKSETTTIFSNFSCMFLNHNIFFQFEF